jgi:hypothetical protein
MIFIRGKNRAGTQNKKLNFLILLKTNKVNMRKKVDISFHWKTSKFVCLSKDEACKVQSVYNVILSKILHLHFVFVILLVTIKDSISLIELFTLAFAAFV